MKVTDYIALFLAERGVSHVFEMSGGMITHLLDSLHACGRIGIVSMHHEQAAAFAADAAGRLTGVPGVALATSGPGATNLLTGIGSCFFDSTPAVFITGQVNRDEQRGDRPIRQLGFQETDIVAMAGPITKAAWMVREPEEVPGALAHAFATAVEGRPGPVLLDIPMDVQRAGVDPPSSAHVPVAAASDVLADTAMWDDLFSALEHSVRPLILVGGGVPGARAISQFGRFVQTIRIPVVTSLMAIDALPYSDPLRVGWIGSYGNRWANLAVGRSDLLLVLGSRLDIRQTGSDTTAFKGNRVIFQVDCEAGEINNRVTGCQPIVADVREFLEAAVQVTQDRNHSFAERTAWLTEIDDARRAWPDTDELAGVPGINPNRFMHQLSAISGAAGTYVVDVGQHQMWAAQSLEVNANQRFLTSGGMGSMGFALPAAVGAAYTLGGRPVVVIAGDGSFQSNIQELQTVARGPLPLKIVVINNGCHGMVRQFQQSYFNERYQSTLWGYSAPDFAAVAVAYGLPGRTIACEDDIEAALQWLWQDPVAPAVLQVMIDTYANVYPKIAFGHPITEMEPFVKPIAMEST